jgi:hypothetical protein
MLDEVVEKEINIKYIKTENKNQNSESKSDKKGKTKKNIYVYDK